MKINKENMKRLADWIGGADAPTLDEVTKVVTAGTIYKMAYQNQKFFEAMEKLKLLPGTSWADADTVYKTIDLFDAAIIDKVDA